MGRDLVAFSRPAHGEPDEAPSTNVKIWIPTANWIYLVLHRPVALHPLAYSLGPAATCGNLRTTLPELRRWIISDREAFPTRSSR